MIGGKEESIIELLKPFKQGHIRRFDLPLLDVVNDYVTNPDAIVVCTVPIGIIVRVKMLVILMLPLTKEKGNEEFMERFIIIIVTAIWKNFLS